MLVAAYKAPYLIVYSENAVDIFDIHTSEWIQTIPLKKVRPLSRDGALNLVGSFEPAKLTYMKNIHGGTYSMNKIIE